MRVLICGSRDWTDQSPIAVIVAGLAQLDVPVTVIHGAARGADSIGGYYAKAWGMEVIEEPADWDTYGKSAGPRRNEKMLYEHTPDVVYAFRLDGESRGTDHMIEIARDADVPTYVMTMPRSKTEGK